MSGTGLLRPGNNAGRTGAVVADALPTVVNISVLRSDVHEWSGNGAPNQHKRNVGSGVIVESSGVIVTNAHVVEGHGNIRVTLQDGTDYSVVVLGQDSEADIAVLRVAAMVNLPTARWGDSLTLRPGDPVLAIGNPFGLGGTVTAGIVSGMNRDVHLGPRDAFIQTDAHVNRGNSGGPLLTLNGEIVGINTALMGAMNEGGSVGIGFAIPSAEAKSIVEHLIRYGAAHPRSIGVRTQQLTPDLAVALGLGRSMGALVAEVDMTGPAAGKIEPGDLIQRIGETRIKNSRELSRVVAAQSLGLPVTVELERHGRSMSVTVRVVLAPNAGCKDGPLEPPPAAKPPIDLGLAVRDQTEEDRARLKLGPNDPLAIVESVIPFSPAADQKLAPGAAIRMVGFRAVTSRAEFDARMAEGRQSGARFIGLLIIDQDGPRWVAMPLADDPDLIQSAGRDSAKPEACPTSP
jgi:serine protease Do